MIMASVMLAASIPAAAGATGTADVDPAAVQESSGDTGAAQAEGAGDTAADNTGVGTDTADTQTTDNDTSLTDGTQDAADEDTEQTETETEEEGTEPISIDVPDGAADSGRVVTLGENLNEAQRESMYAYFGTSPEEVRTIVVTHADEVKYMQGIATDEQIGPTTNSCAYVEPTDSGGIKVKTANLNFVTSAMIASTLTTAGMENCNVIAACPFEVSGTGALTGIIMAYETASGESLNEGQKEAAVEELITTGNLADTIGQETASEVMNDVKTEILDKGLTDPGEIGEAVDKIAAKYEVTLTDEQRAQIVELMEKISQFDYDVNALKNTLDNLTGEDGVFTKIWNSIKSFFVGSDDGILSGTNDEALGGNVITDSTVSESGFKDGLWTRIKNFFGSLGK